MERQELERRITHFQANARGFLVRKTFSGVRQDYEDIVREIDGDLSHLEWRGSIISIPHFTENAFVWQSHTSATRENSGQSCSVSEKPTAEPRVEASLEAPGFSSDSLTPVRDHNHQVRAIVQDSEPSRPVEGNNERTRHTSELNLCTEAHIEVEPLEGEPGSMAEETSIWDSMAMDTGYSFLQKGSPRRSLAQEVPRTQEALCLHRNNLAMELLWLQQAIASRKKYLLLKQRL
ncbi:hypothetical protein AAFF_G00184960 [Aldrovandia affinis]|uniref:IQ domain-containing protein C n=1 Tax=Aldrovandia affinis TaxID=143900 RepID=A0AAD7W6F2_9TELE|nr:hypothetical protein AAFF_G00184960 [Aldrovandia affinis]